MKMFITNDVLKHIFTVPLCSDLVSSPNIFLMSVNMDALRYIRRLLLESHQNIAGFIVKT